MSKDRGGAAARGGEGIAAPKGTADTHRLNGGPPQNDDDEGGSTRIAEVPAKLLEHLKKGNLGSGHFEAAPKTDGATEVPTVRPPPPVGMDAEGNPLPSPPDPSVSGDRPVLSRDRAADGAGDLRGVGKPAAPEGGDAAENRGRSPRQGPPPVNALANPHADHTSGSSMAPALIVGFLVALALVIVAGLRFVQSR